MSDTNELSLRVVEIERRLRDIEQVVARLDGAALPSAIAPDAELPSIDLTAVPPLPPPPVVQRRVGRAAVVRGGEYWLNKVGIGLFLLGLAFLFKYAIDQGWLTPWVRVGIGVGAALLLLGIGLRLRTARPAFAQVLQGGGIAALYISAFAAFELYTLVPYQVAFGWMCLTTLLSFGLALRQNAMPLSLIAALGGLGTPFILYTDSGGVAGLVAYTCLVLGGIIAIYLFRGWRALLWTGFVGSWLVLLVALESANPGEQWAVQLGILLTAALLWPIPVLRAALLPASAARPGLLGPLHVWDLGGLAVLTPFAALGLTMELWSLSDQASGWLTLGTAGAALGIAVVLSRLPHLRPLCYAHGLAALLLLTASLVLLLDGNALLLALAIEAALVHLLISRRGDSVATIFGHVLFGVLGLQLAERLLNGAGSPPLLNAAALTNSAVLGLAFASSLLLRSRQATTAYWLAIHLLLLTLLASELAPLPDGNAYITASWGLYGVALLVLGLRRDLTTVVLMGIGTLLLVVAKLLVVDLSSLAAIWRVLLFMGIGSAFLVLSYYYRALWRPRSAEEQQG